MTRRLRCVVWFILAVLCSSRPAYAQTFSGTIVGRVLDSQQAVVPYASVTLLSAEITFERHTLSNAQGEYVFELVPPGRFQLLVEHAGFAPTALKVEVVVATPLRVDIVLRVQAIQQQLKVIGEGGVAVQTENASLGRVISPHEMTELPSLGRSLYDFIGLMSGATLSNDGLGVGFSVNGGRTQSANYLLDGAEDNDITMSAPAMDVPLDSVQEFNIQTNHFSAEYGRDSGFTANIVTKSGTNDFHGSIYDYVRNSAFAANTFDNNANNLPRAEFNRNQFGGTAGGPLRKGKVFFFASTEGILVRSSGPTSFYVPTPELLAISAPGTQAIFDRYPLPTNLSATNVRTESLCPYATPCDAQTHVGYITIPAFAYTTRIGPQDFGAGPPQDTVLATGRLDWTLGPNTQAFVRYAIESKDEFAVAYQPYSSELDQPVYGHNQNASINLIHTWSPRFATETRIAYDRVTGDPDRFGGDAYAVPKPLLPYFYIQDETATLPGGSPAGYGPTNGYQFFQTVTYSRGRHTLRFGGQFVHLRQNFTFGIAGEVANAQFANTQGFVDGMLELYQIALDPKGHLPGQYLDPPFGPPSFTRHYHYNEPALFVADTWKITAHLVLTPGLRWEYFGVFHSPGAEHTLDSNFYPGLGSTLQRIASGQMMRTVDAIGQYQGRFYLPSYKNFAPRLGLAYDVTGDGKTVIRAGAGMFYDGWVGWELYRAYQNPPGYSFEFLSDIPMTPEIVTNQYAAFPNSPVLLSQSATQAPVLHMHTAYVASWNATVEQELAINFVVGASYLGSSGSRLYSGNNVNRLGSGGLLDPSCINSRIASDGVSTIGPDYSNCPRLNPNISNIVSRGNDGHSSFNALQLRIDSKRLSRLGLEFGANYTLSHSIDNRSVSGISNSIGGGGAVGYLDAFAPSLDRGSSDFDARHRVAMHFIWEIPAIGSSPGWLQPFLLRNWELSGFVSYQTGQPFSLQDLGTPDVIVERTRPRLTGTLPHTSLIPDALTGNSYLYLPINQVYDPLTELCVAQAKPFACEISVNGPFQGTLPRNTFRQPGLFFWNTAVIKNVPLASEKTKLQFRVEFYNLLNHSNLYVKDSSTDVSTSSFTNSSGQFIPGVTASFHDNRQIVLAVKLLF